MKGEFSKFALPQSIQFYRQVEVLLVFSGAVKPGMVAMATGVAPPTGIVPVLGGMTGIVGVPEKYKKKMNIAVVGTYMFNPVNHVLEVDIRISLQTFFKGLCLT